MIRDKKIIDYKTKRNDFKRLHRIGFLLLSSEVARVYVQQRHAAEGRHRILHSFVCGVDEPSAVRKDSRRKERLPDRPYIFCYRHAGSISRLDAMAAEAE